MNPSWTEFIEDEPNTEIILPTERRDVLCVITPDITQGERDVCVCVGYLRYSGGDKQSPFFVTPSAKRNKNRRVIAFSDCLGNDFEYPYHLGRC